MSVCKQQAVEGGPLWCASCSHSMYVHDDDVGCIACHVRVNPSVHKVVAPAGSTLILGFPAGTSHKLVAEMNARLKELHPGLNVVFVAGVEQIAVLLPEEPS